MSSGHLRTLALTRYLPQFGWAPIVLSAHHRAYPRVDERLLADLPDELLIRRTFALDASRHLSIRGAYPLLWAQPDRWSSWWPGAVMAGLKLIRAHRPSVIWSTYPIATAHLIAYTLHRLTGVPWVADFRDPMKASHPLTARTQRWIERGAMAHAAAAVVTTPSAQRLYQQRYPQRRAPVEVVPNGYDERAFEKAAAEAGNKKGRDEARIELVHSGLLYRDGRDPSTFFRALSDLRQRGIVGANSLHVVLRASGSEDEYAAMLADAGVADMVSLAPPLDYHSALVEQMRADGLLLFQGTIYNEHIPAKVYEYLRVGRPILALVDGAGDTAELLRSEGIDTLAPLDDAALIAAQLQRVIQLIRDDSAVLPSRQRVSAYSREASVARYAEILDGVV